MSVEQVFYVTVSEGEYVIDGESAPTVDLISGKTYQFDLSDPSLSSHPFWFKYQGIPIDESLVNTTGQLGVDQILTYTAPGASSGELTYYCQNHSGMGGDFEIVRNVITGTEDGDELTGSAGDDVITGGGGDDTLSGQAGNDLIYGGDGDDFLLTGSGIDQLFGESGDDTLRINGTGTSTLDGGEGIDTFLLDLTNYTPPVDDFVNDINLDTGVVTAAGTDSDLADTLISLENIDYRGSFPSRLIGDNHNNTISGGSGNDSLNGGAGNDTLYGGDGDDTLLGGAGNDTLDAGSGDDKLYGGAGDDILIHSGSGAQLFDGGDGIDTYKKSAVEAGLNLNIEVNLASGYTGSITDRDHPLQDTVINIENIDFSLVDWELSLIGDETNNILIAGSGNDTLNGGSGDDEIYGGSGDDTLSGGEGNDTLNGGAGNDLIYGGDGDDTILQSGSGTQHYDGGDGIDTYKLNTAEWNGLDFDIKVDLSSGFSGLLDDPDHILNDTLINIENIDFSDVRFDCRLLGNAADNVISGGTGNDNIDGGTGNDTIDGGAGNDTLNGGAGDETLSGGLGSDKFIFEADFGSDTITDFTHGMDELKFYDANGNLLTSTDISETQNEDGDAVLTVSDGSSVTLSGVSVYSLPFNIVSQKSGDYVTVNFYLDPNQDPGDTGVGSFNATLGFEPNNLTYVSSSFADGLTGVPNATAVDSGTLGLGGFGLTPVTDLDAALFSVTFEATAVTEPVQITLSEVEIDATSLAGGTYTINLTGATVSGSVLTRSGTALSDVLLETDTGLSTQTSSAGAFEIDLSGSEQLLSGSLSFSNTGSTKAISAADALDALKLSVGLPTDAGVSDAFSLISADFDQNGKVTASDALEILKYSVGLPTEQNAQWVFLDTNADYSHVGRSATNYTEGVSLADITSDATIGLTGILIGDVNDSYIGVIA